MGDVAIVGDLGLVARQPNEQTGTQAAEFALWRQGQAVAGKEEWGTHQFQFIAMLLCIVHQLEQIGRLLEAIMHGYLAELLVKALELQTLLALHIRLIVGNDVEQNIVYMQYLIVFQIV